MIALQVPTVSILLGQGTGGGALALVPADRILAAQHGWLSPLPPEGASAILYRDTSHAPAMAAVQGIRSAELLANGIVDCVIPEYPDAAAEPERFCRRIGAAVQNELATLANTETAQRLVQREHRFDRIGQLHPVLASIA